MQYTRNTVTGASTADVVVLLVDARHGVVEQTRRHLAVASLLRVPHVVVAVNKIDLVDFDEERYAEVADDVASSAAEPRHRRRPRRPGLRARRRQRRRARPTRTPWYDGPSLLELLENAARRRSTPHAEPLRFPVQLVIRPQGAAGDEFRDYRGYAGQVAAGLVARRRPRRRAARRATRTTVAGIDTADGQLAEARSAAQSVTLRLADDIDVARGDLIASAADAPPVTQDSRARSRGSPTGPCGPARGCCSSTRTRTVQAVVRDVVGRLDLDAAHLVPAEHLDLNDIGRVTLRLAAPIAAEEYLVSRTTGRSCSSTRRTARRSPPAWSATPSPPPASRATGPCSTRSEGRSMSQQAYAVSLPVAGRRVLVVGAGTPGTRRALALVAAGAQVDVVAPTASDDVRRAAAEGRLTWSARPYRTADLAGAWLVHAATGDGRLDRRVATDAEEARTWCVVDAEREPRLRRPGPADRTCRARRRRPRRWRPHHRARAHAAGQADVVVVDRLAPHALLADLAPDVEVVDVGKSPAPPGAQHEINAVLVDRARAGKRVVRLKGGDPYVFGRGGEEHDACVDAGVPVEVVPGVTSAVSVPAAAGIPVTHRGVARAFTVVTGHDDAGRVPTSSDHTLVLLMGLARLERTCAELIARRPRPGLPRGRDRGRLRPAPAHDRRHAQHPRRPRPRDGGPAAGGRRRR